MPQQKSEGNKAENPDCSCPETWCARHGKCSKCQAYHHRHRERTSCEKQNSG